ncbi:DUF1173 family protein [Desulfurobacterium atlanticum]|uniref:Uncharacterized protein n=1 Tax=Desulfurobacterium atlanticum TaxID=240169 RepID=A0A239AE28_9BACT|nr:DUF1173 family protein [Desulfurobacterium atlanticum]SNR93829.1 Protein of unknown function [Desulfurobacterium atlanticum]
MRKLIAWQDGKFLKSFLIENRWDIRSSEEIQQLLEKVHRRGYLTCGCKSPEGEYLKLYVKKYRNSFYIASYPGVKDFHSYRCPFFSGLEKFIKETEDGMSVSPGIFHRSGIAERIFNRLIFHLFAESYYFAFNIKNKGVSRFSGNIEKPSGKEIVRVFVRYLRERLKVSGKDFDEFLIKSEIKCNSGIIFSFEELDRAVKANGYVVFCDKDRGRERQVYFPLNSFQKKRRIMGDFFPPLFFVSFYRPGNLLRLFLFRIFEGIPVKSESERDFVRIEKTVLKPLTRGFDKVLTAEVLKKLKGKLLNMKIPDFVVFGDGAVVLKYRDKDIEIR